MHQGLYVVDYLHMTYCLLQSSRVCPFDQSSINEGLPVNEAILCAVSGPVDQVSRRHSEPTYGIEPFEVSDYHKAIECLKCLASLLRPNPNSMFIPSLDIPDDDNNCHLCRLSFIPSHATKGHYTFTFTTGRI